MFVDTIHLLLQAGDGGKGCESFYHRLDRKIMADGGEGGDGGSVIFRADLNAPPISQFSFKQHLIAESGVHGRSVGKRGRNGKDLILLVPPGTKIFDRERKLLIRELPKHGEEVVVLKGGKGGVGNQTGKSATFGEKGKTLDVELRMRLQADIFLLGLPSSGKSTLMNKLTNTHLKEESYPFATISPEIGVYQKSDYEQMRLCELPSLYHASHEGRGRGNDFLKHLENARFILCVLAPDSEFSESIEDGWKILRREIELYNPKFLEIPYGVIINKRDLLSRGEQSAFSVGHRKVPKFFISAMTGQGMDELRSFLDARIDEREAEKNSKEESSNA